MANICSYNMAVRGTKENIETFINMVNQKGTCYMGRGAEVYDVEYEQLEENLWRCTFDGCTKWSIQASLVMDAISMRKTPERWAFSRDTDRASLTFVTLYEACEQLNIDMECYSEESDMGFQEHFLFKDGQLVLEECVEYSEEYDEENDEWIPEGGFGEWCFEI